VSDPAALTPELVDAIGRLVPQLSSSSPPPRASDLSEIVGSSATVLLVAEDDAGRLLGMLTLAVFRLPTGVRAWIEDVVVDELARGRGAGEALVKVALDRAGAAGARSVDLTSRPSRVAANRLYRRLGFAERQTNVYRWSGDADGSGGPDGSGDEPADAPENGASRAS
jgi:ribosomal protein S18 acetylase RimI-like enzyme